MMEGAEVAGADDADAGKVMNGMGGKRDFFLTMITKTSNILSQH